jgi:hypothetical protein
MALSGDGYPDEINVRPIPKAKEAHQPIGLERSQSSISWIDTNTVRHARIDVEVIRAARRQKPSQSVESSAIDVVALQCASSSPSRRMRGGSTEG